MSTNGEELAEAVAYSDLPRVQAVIEQIVQARLDRERRSRADDGTDWKREARKWQNRAKQKQLVIDELLDQIRK